MNSMHMRLSPLFSLAMLLICLASSSRFALCQSQTILTTGTVDVRILNAIHEPEESSVSYVTVAVTVRSAGTPFVIPTCTESGAPPYFRMASLRRANGKAVPVRKGLEATLGFEDQGSWKPVQVPANGGAVDFQFSIDMGLLDVRPGERVRLAFWIWPDSESMKDLKRGKMALSPVFRIPVRPD
jgi:hypothetical protein